MGTGRGGTRPSAPGGVPGVPGGAAVHGIEKFCLLKDFVTIRTVVHFPAVHVYSSTFCTV